MNKILKNFYCIEGIDGSGKTSIIQKLQKLCNNKLKYYFTKEPSQGVIGEFIRQQLTNFKNPLRKVSLAYLYVADRYEHLYNTKNGIIEILNKGKTKVITDRYLFSSIAYQGELGYKLNKDFPLPEKLFFIKTDPGIAYKRIQENRIQADLFEFEAAKFKEINSRYTEMLKIFDDLIDIVYIENSNEEDLETSTRKIFDLIKF
ncbi:MULTISPECIES: dTMP kinase [Borrelia]|uniref:Thymidylate kinase n=2 Tax=Borrelia turicatae TaxID=142 RepID=A0A172XC63_BORTU|nr:MULTISPECIES: dTMP kinase [Borrelia]AAX18108.1 thymidylate kinase [Borrelia turicatae 91E135]ANF34241.1 dTMP kinase [Borrelia turicatae]UPA12435.1 dTMP kinase [Borrelia venezuelensis]UPA13608.1 dTMP kinase [Borrelia turicatae 91E135]UPA15090.1 dTMP kinase [Borrelia turicatae]